MTEETKMILEKLDGMQGQLKRVEKKVDSLEGKVDSLEGKVDSLEGKVDSLEGKVDSLEGKVNNLTGMVNSLEGRMGEMEDSFKNLKIFVENDIQRNITVVAEGHLDLSRKLDEALKVSQKQELYYLKVNNLEADMRRVKKQIGITA